MQASSFLTAVGVFALLTTAACSDSAETPTAAPKGLHFEPLRTENPGCDPRAEIQDPDCQPEDLGPVGLYHEEAQAISGTLNFSAYTSDAETAPCPRTVTGGVTGLVRDPKTQDDYEFHSHGTWIIDWLSSLPYLLSGQAVYAWPPGEWMAFNIDRGVGPVPITIRQGRGVCLGGGRVTFIQFYGVEIRDPWIRKSSFGGGSGGGGGGHATCREEYIFLEVDYGDGTGWHVVWEGTATVCE